MSFVLRHIRCDLVTMSLQFVSHQHRHRDTSARTQLDHQGSRIDHTPAQCHSEVAEGCRQDQAAVITLLVLPNMLLVSFQLCNLNYQCHGMLPLAVEDQLLNHCWLVVMGVRH